MKENNEDYSEFLENVSIDEIKKAFNDILEFDEESIFIAGPSGCVRGWGGYSPK